MPGLRYLNVILTVLTLLLALQLWTSLTQKNEPWAVPARAAELPGPGGIPDAGAQRMQVIDLLKQLVQKAEDQKELWRSGQVHVKVDKDPADGKGH
jgi:hypothetical protein